MDVSRQIPEHAEGQNLRAIAGSVLDNLREGCQVIDDRFRYLYINSAVSVQGKKSPGELLGRTMSECYPGIEQTEMFSKLRTCLQVRKPDAMVNEFTFPDSSTGWFELRFEPVPEGVAILSVDVTERIRAENVLKSTSKALGVLSRCNQALIRTDDEQQFVREVCDLLVEVGGYAAAEISLGSTSELTTTAAAHSSPNPGKRPDAEALSLPIVGKTGPLGKLFIWASNAVALPAEERSVLAEVAFDLGYGIETLREREAYRHAEEQLASSRRLEAVGRLAGGIAHDFNNLMSVVLSYTWLIEKRLPKDAPVHADLQEISQAVLRAASLTGQLLAFSRKQVLKPQVTNTNEIIRGIEAMLRRLLGENLQVDIRLEEKLPNVLIDPGQLEQVIMNLAVNARDAMPVGGVLKIETAEIVVSGREREQGIPKTPGRYIVLTATDNGLGMSPETVARIFEPFFTTKEPGSGTGLGLSTVYGIVKQSGGSIDVKSELGAGTCFRIYFPPVDAPVVKQEPAKGDLGTAHNELILLVERDDSVRRATERILQSLGYRVTSFQSAREAFAQSGSLPEDVSLLLTDMLMSDLSSGALLDRLASAQPNLKVLFSSECPELARTRQSHPHKVLPKPFSATDLAVKVREVLEAEA